MVVDWINETDKYKQACARVLVCVHREANKYSSNLFMRCKRKIGVKFP